MKLTKPRTARMGAALPLISVLSRPEERMRRAAVALGVASCIAIGCSVRSRSVIGYAELDNQRWDQVSSGETQVRTIVRDEEGRLLQGIRVYPLPADDRHGPEPVLAITGADGSAMLGAKGGFYAAAAVFVGFEPGSRPIQIADGCAGTLDFTLRVLQAEGLSSGSGRDNKELQRTKPAQAMELRR